MSRYNNNVFAAFFMLVAMCVGLSVAASPLVRSTSTEQDRVYDFTISETKDSVSWTAFGREWNVRLELSDVVEDNTDYYHGSLEGDENAVVSFALLPGSGLSGMVATGDSTWWIRAMPVAENNYSENDEALGHFMLREQGSLQAAAAIAPFEAPLEADIDPVVDQEAEAGGQKRSVTSYKLAIYFDQNWVKSTNPWASQANTLGLLNDVNAIYKAAGVGTFQVVYGKQITNSQTSLSAMLSYFANTASASISAFTDRSYTSYMWLVGGLTYVGTACKGTSAAQKQKTGVAGLVSWSRLWTVKTIAHELGHNRGAVHEFTNQCSGSTTTGCQCSLMSYCFPSASNNPTGALNYFTSTSVATMKAAGCY